MATQREHVFLNGKLTGMGREAPCTISAIKVSLPGTAEYAYTRCEVYRAPDDLPEGTYTIEFDGQSEQLKKSGGFWLGVGR